MTLKISLWKIIALSLTIYFVKSYFWGPKTIEVTEKEFSKMATNKELEKVTLISNTKTVRIKVKKEKIKEVVKRINERRKKEKLDNDGENAVFPQWTEKIKEAYFNTLENLRDVTFILKIPSVKIFNDNYKEAEKKLNEEEQIGYNTEEKTFIFPIISSIVHFLFTLALILIILNPEIIFGGKTGGFSSIFGENENKLYNPLKDNKITLKDIAGMDEVKEEVIEIINLYKNKKHILSLGGRLIKGLLLVGPPGNGKTLIAKAIAGETDVAFFYACGSDFSGIYWGLGSKKINMLFDRAAKMGRGCIIFIDEIDSIGRSRKKQMTTNEDGENTLNTLLSRMDGFNSNKGVLVIGATNRIEIMDNALLRPGRFDRHISIDLPHIEDRKKILSFYLEKITTSKNVNVDLLAERTAGYSSAELEGICNEATLIAGRRKAKSVQMEDLQEAIERTELGIEKKTKVMSEKEKYMISYHECGHAIVGWFLKNCTPPLKVSIIPRGKSALGYTFYSNKEQNIKTKEEIEDEICSYLGGRVAEEIIFKSLSTGAGNDLENVFRLAKMIVTVYGMGKSLGPISLYNPREEALYPVSEDTAKNMDIEIRKIVARLYKKTKYLLIAKKDLLVEMAEELLKKEKLEKEEIKAILGSREHYYEYEEEEEEEEIK